MSAVQVRGIIWRKVEGVWHYWEGNAAAGEIVTSSMDVLKQRLLA